MKTNDTNTDNINANEINTTESAHVPHPMIACIPILVLVGMMVLIVKLFGGDALGGGIQIAMLMSTAVCVCLAMWVYRMKWKELEKGIVNTISNSASSLIILLLIGMMSASWMISGVVPTLIYYGVQIMSPTFFLFSTCLICAVVSVMTGSSWTTVATIGVALIGIGSALGIPEYWSAGAIISGAYFGDKVSPLSDTTVLASSCSGVNLFNHIRYLLFTTVPAMSITLVIFFVSGFFMNTEGNIRTSEYTEGLEGSFNISLWTLLVPAITAVMIARKLPSLVILFVSALMAGVMAMIMQPDVLLAIGGGEGQSDFVSMVKGVMMVFVTSTNIDTGSASVNELVGTSGMSGMMNTIWLILCAMCYGGVMMASRMIHSLTALLIRVIRGTASLVASTVATGIMNNILVCDQYVSIIITTDMFREIYKEKGYESRLLSRSTEDSSTITSVLVPWNTCGMTQSTVLGVATLSYLPYCFFNLISPLMSIIVATIGWKIAKPGVVRDKDK